MCYYQQVLVVHVGWRRPHLLTVQQLVELHGSHTDIEHYCILSGTVTSTRQWQPYRRLSLTENLAWVKFCSQFRRPYVLTDRSCRWLLHSPIGVPSIAISVFVCMYVCLFVCLSVCLSVCISQKPHVPMSLNFLYMLPVAVARSSSNGSAIRDVLPVMWMTL